MLQGAGKWAIVTAMNLITSRRGCVLVLLAMVGMAAGCRSHRAAKAPPRAAAATEASVGAPSSTSITLDGDTADWPETEVIAADDHYIYIRFTVEDAQYTLQAAPIMTAIMLDVDGDVSTGRTGDMQPMSWLGSDLEIDFSPRNHGAAGHGVVVYSLDSAGRRTVLSTADVDFSCAPSYASSWYECRISRTPDNAGALPRAGMLSSGTVRGVVATFDKDGKIDGYTDPFAVNAGPAAPGKALATVDMPVKPEGAVRVMEYNVEKSSPTAKPEQFRRVFQAVKPDVILLEEWETGDAAAVQAWFTAMVSSEVTWNVRKAGGDNATGGGVAIVTPYPLVAMTGDTITLPPGATGKNAPEHKVRFVGAKVATPVAELLVGATHLKCCGSKDSPEDQTRLAEARGINAAFQSAAGAMDKGAMRVIAGDMNLVGTRPPLDLLRAGLDVDGSELGIAPAMVLGDKTYATWRDPASGYAAGRLDFVLYSDANAQVVNAFVLDTSRLSDESLARMGLDRGDCNGSDHLPVIVDLKPAAR
jgi:endonuclease/exonuclease/phosphatase family metal-dependent hydrolase